MQAKPQEMDFGVMDDPRAEAKALALYELVSFKQQLEAADTITWNDYFFVVLRCLLPIAFASYCFGTPHNGVLGCFILAVAALAAFDLYHKRAKKREAILVKCVQTLISEVTARGAGVRLSLGFQSQE